MRIDRVTMTGADDSVDPKELVRLSQQYPFVEWGILFSQKHLGHERFPSMKWIEELQKAWVPGMLLSAHVCGRYTRDMINGLDGGDLFMRDMGMCLAHFERIQWNFHAERFRSMNFTKISRHLGCYPRLQQIFQMDGVNDAMVDILQKMNTVIHPLYDTSGGAGIVPLGWPPPMPGIYCGYAGGLGPQSLKGELPKIERVVKDSTIWIDMETHVRSMNGVKFDLSKVEACLNMVMEYP